MRRSPIVIAATLAGVAGVLTFHTKKPATIVSAPASGSSSTTTPPATSAPASGSGSTSGAGSSTTAPAGGTRSATGKTIPYGYGELAVKVTVNGSKITNLKIVTLATAEAYSQQLAQQVIPMLQHEVMQAQSARIQGIAGATYTSEAYAQSVQAALDTLHA
ncbi:FMN-binding protein [Acidimicrobiaceae bacterium USS-CC1]|uniref:FMN-binding protein n=1 Tax=Acidiferrimicrobium australe TaxID=2664430 RepID=A0ABW9QXM2_9ACTN|nr:FMN-binding protein [Acidiferrimicrobium australe]